MSCHPFLEHPAGVPETKPLHLLVVFALGLTFSARPIEAFRPELSKDLNAIRRFAALVEVERNAARVCP